ncbi:Bug family tripartite tricarboxylate transporter substrate binding protein [Variovorax saccharolyticus]|uniref:Bug family tripartite tricarboxylate transporter substrate binding protein n=1 Tax=Variovorax saccharolyticus TaxID=3053516 RepID=UPI0025770F02|nr:tripartite tricarboxylate transporter substrate-binding protein [Variovorax sp. J31P216]MDM0025222.1 tripartite tricarboxylate transporter substrate-binding protein [Variovorax sp. J31P216]
MFQHRAGISMRHVPYKGGAQALTDVVGGHVEVLAMFCPVPTVAESGFAGFEASVWYALVGPADLPAPVAQSLHAAAQKAIASAQVRDLLAAAGGVSSPGSMEQVQKLLSAEATRYDRIIRDAGIQPD